MIPVSALKHSRIIHRKGIRARVCGVPLATEPPPTSDDEEELALLLLEMGILQ
ncbi:hypothetical protein H0H93_004231, partial [Arthromyces matolae]